VGLGLAVPAADRVDLGAPFCTPWRNGGSPVLQEIDFLPAFLEALPEPVVLVGAGDRILAANKPARVLFPALRAGDLLALVLRAPDVLDSVARVRASNLAETVNWRERVPVERVFDIHVAPLALIGRPSMLVLSLRDLTEARNLERMRADFVANASHELRTPLASLLGFIETLQGPARDDARARERFLGIMGEQARRMSRLIDDLLSLSRIEQNLHLRPEGPADLVSALLHVADAMAPLAHENGVEFSIEAPAEAIVAGDRDELIRVIENLLENAIKYGAGAEGDLRPVTVRIAIEDSFARLTVRDHGPGIAAEHLPRLTERFYRVDPGQSRAKGGTGLGLAIVKHIVARHRGRLLIESRAGEGASFTVLIPVIGK